MECIVVKVSSKVYIAISFPEPAIPWEGNGCSGIIRDRHTKTVCCPYCACVGNKPQKHFSKVFWNSICTISFVMSVENIILFHSVVDEALERLGKKNLKLKECQYEAVKAVVVDRKIRFVYCLLVMERHLYTSFFPNTAY